MVVGGGSIRVGGGGGGGGSPGTEPAGFGLAEPSVDDDPCSSWILGAVGYAVDAVGDAGVECYASSQWCGWYISVVIGMYRMRHRMRVSDLK